MIEDGGVAIAALEEVRAIVTSEIALAGNPISSCISTASFPVLPGWTGWPAGTAKILTCVGKPVGMAVLTVTSTGRRPDGDAVMTDDPGVFVLVKLATA